MDLTALVSASIKAQPSPRRNLPEFRMQGTLSNPEAPPPTPTDESFLFTPSSAHSSEKRVRFDFGDSPRSSEESIRSDDSAQTVDSDESAR